MNDKTRAWNKLNLSVGIAPPPRHHPSELMMRALLSKRYCSLAPNLRLGTRVLDIGTMYLNNLVPFLERGCACTGVEINDDMVAIARAAAEDRGVTVDLLQGVNRDLPFPDGRFDIVLAINVIHYEDGPDQVKQALKEYRRVLAPGGRVFIVSAGPEHHVRASAERLGANQYRISAADDFRQGQVMSYFEDERDLAEQAGSVFHKVVTGRMIETHDQAKVDFLYAVCALRA